MKNKILNATFVIFLISLLYLLIKQFSIQRGLLSWNISEFLINYESGFVRRGFSGEILFCIAKYINFDIESWIKIFCLIVFLILVFFFVKAFLIKGYSLYILPLCFFLGAPILGDFWLRKDCWMICLFIVIVKLFVVIKDKSILASIFIVNILAICLFLIHEVFAFFMLPILFILFINLYKSLNKNTLGSVVLSILSLLPTIIVFLIIILYHGNPVSSQVIWNSWCILLDQNISDVGTKNSIGAISWSTLPTIKMHFSTNLLFIDQGIYSLLYWIIIIPAVYYISINVLMIFKKSINSFMLKDQTSLSVVLIFQFICLIPVFLFLSCDYMRLFFYWISTSFIIFILVPSHILEVLFPDKCYEKACLVNSKINTLIYPTKTVIVLLMLFINISNVSFYMSYVYSSTMIYRFLWIISKPFIYLLDFIKPFF